MILSYSGGLDSTALLYRYRNGIKLAVSFKLASKQNDKEIACAKYHCEKLGIKHIIVDITNLFAGFKSALFEGNKRKIDGDTIVPFRNGIMLSIIASLAEEHRIKQIAIANHQSDDFTYPDTTSAFIKGMRIAVKEGTLNRVQLFDPFTNKSKRDIAWIGRGAGADLSKTWSCYEGKEKHCGECLTCRQRKQALLGFDETEYLC